MLYCEDWDKKKEKFLEYWALENHDRPLIHVTARKEKREPVPVSNHATLAERWMDTEFLIKKANADMRNTAYLGEAFPSFLPNLGPDFMATIYGTEIEFGDRTSWAIPWMSDDFVENYTGLNPDYSNKYYQKTLEITKAAVEDGKDKYFVGLADLHPGADALVSMRGPQELCYDTFDNPDFIKKGVWDVLPHYQKVYEDLYQLTTKYQKGTSCWLNLWHPGRWYPVSCDFSCMVSQDMYEEFLIEEMEAEAKYLDASIYHLDGPDALKHLDRILKIPGLNGVQWAYGAGQPTASHWIPTLKKIQDAGKCIYVQIVPEELEVLCKELRPEGVFYKTSVKTEEEGRQLVKMAEEWSKR